jgi:hypothetical protein
VVDICSATLQPALAPPIVTVGGATCVLSIMRMCALTGNRALRVNVETELNFEVKNEAS